jgi:DNA-binding transcriptional ArsR family regulator
MRERLLQGLGVAREGVEQLHELGGQLRELAEQHKWDELAFRFQTATKLVERGLEKIEQPLLPQHTRLGDTKLSTLSRLIHTHHKESRGMTVTELANDLKMRPQSLSMTLSRLAEGGFVQKKGTGQKAIYLPTEKASALLSDDITTRGSGSSSAEAADDRSS